MAEDLTHNPAEAIKCLTMALKEDPNDMHILIQRAGMFC